MAIELPFVIIGGFVILGDLIVAPYQTLVWLSEQVAKGQWEVLLALLVAILIVCGVIYEMVRRRQDRMLTCVTCGKRFETEETRPPGLALPKPSQDDPPRPDD